MSIVNSILKIFVGDKSANDIKAIQPIVNKINSYQEALKSNKNNNCNSYLK